MESLHISLALSTPMLLSANGYLTLDGLLAVLYEKNYAEQATPELLPIAFEGRIAKASMAFIEHGVLGRRQLYGGLTPEDIRDVIELVEPVRTQGINQDAKKYKRSNSRLMSINTPAVHWFCIGDAERILALLKTAPGIGRKATSGYGQIDWVESEIESWPSDWSWEKNGSPMRPLPTTTWEKLGFSIDTVQIGQASTQHPYWEIPPEECALPSGKFINFRKFCVA